MDSIARSFSRHLLTNSNLTGLYRIAATVFSVAPTKHSVLDIAPCLPISDWIASGIGLDPWAVMYGSTLIDNAPFLLIATRVYMPGYFRFPDHVTAEPWLAEPTGEKFRIIWSDIQEWYSAALTYLTTEGDDIELALPEEPSLDKRMNEHNEWFERAIGLAHGEGRYSEPNPDSLLPYVTERGCYLIFGFPAASCFTEDLGAWKNFKGSDGPCVINDQIACLDIVPFMPNFMSNSTIEGEYVKALIGSIFSHPACMVEALLQQKPKQLVAVRPASHYDVTRYLRVELEADEDEEILILKTDEPDIALKVIDRIAKHDLGIFMSEFGTKIFVIELDVSNFEDLRGFSFSLELMQTQYFRSSNLIGRTAICNSQGRRMLYLEIHSTFIALIERMGKKVVTGAIQHGLVIRRPIGFESELNRLPKWTQTLPPASEEAVESFEQFSLDGKNMSLFDLFRHARPVRYRRDNF